MSNDSKTKLHLVVQRKPWQVEGEELLPQWVQDEISLVMRDLGELPDRNSPDEFPDCYVVTRQEIVAGILQVLRTAECCRSEAAAADSERLDFLAEVTNLSVLRDWGATLTAEQVRRIAATSEALSSIYEMHRRTCDTPTAFRLSVDAARGRG